MCLRNPAGLDDPEDIFIVIGIARIVILVSPKSEHHRLGFGRAANILRQIGGVHILTIPGLVRDPPALLVP